MLLKERLDPGPVQLAELSENSYRLLGAYRGLSESLVRFAEAAGTVDWQRLTEPRF